MACRVPGVDLQACPAPIRVHRTLNTKMDMASLLLKPADYGDSISTAKQAKSSYKKWPYEVEQPEG